MIKCKDCGKEIEDGMKFCTYCGAEVNRFDKQIEEVDKKKKKARLNYKIDKLTDYIFDFAFALAFAIWFTHLALTFDVGVGTTIIKVGEVQIGTQIGFSSINQYIYGFISRFRFRNEAYNISKSLYGYCFFIGIVPTVLLAKELIVKKSPFKVNTALYKIWPVYFATWIVCYVFNNKVIVDYKPVLNVKSELEISFPVIEIMIPLVMCRTLNMLLKEVYGIKHEGRRYLIGFISFVYCLVLIVSRFLASAEWTTDIIGGILYAIAIVQFYKVLIYCKNLFHN